MVKVEAYSSAAQEPNVRLLKWSFGKSLDAGELRFGYVIRFAHDPTSEQTRLDWQYGGESCQGIYNSVTRTAVLNFFLRTSTVTITYRVLDADSMACTIVEVDESSAPTIQYGHMYASKMRIVSMLHTLLHCFALGLRNSMFIPRDS